MLGPEAFYMRIGAVIREMPEIPESGPLPEDVRIWLASAYALVKQGGDFLDINNFKDYSARLNSQPIIRSRYLEFLKDILYRTHAVAELKAPASVHGSFIPAGNPFDAMMALEKVVQTAKKQVLIVDPYMDHQVLSDFGMLIPENVALRLLADEKLHKQTLPPAVKRWIAQYGVGRPLAAKLAARGTLHDRLILVDQSSAFVLTQSLNAFAVRSPASILRSDEETALLKVNAYENIWRAAKPLES